VFGGSQDGPIFLDVTFRLVKAPFYAIASPRMRYLLGLIRALRNLNPVMIEVHVDARIALWLQRLFSSIPVVLVLHDDPAGNRATRSRSKRARLLSRLAGVMTISGWLRDRLIDGIPAPARAPVVVPPAVDFAKLPQSTPGLDSTGIAMAKRRTRLALFVGRLTEEKGADQFVTACTSALPSLPGWRAEIIGAAEHEAGSAETPFVHLLKATAEPASIAMMGYRDHPDVMAAMARAAMVVIPNRGPDPSGRRALEAMANGAAVICCALGALPEIGGDAVIFAKPAELADVIKSLGADPRHLATLGEAGRQRAMHFDLPRIGQLLETIRNQTIAEYAARR
jgi:glycosyltransferase involved in cell wall biosynthesis